MSELNELSTGRAVRDACRSAALTTHTPGLASRFAQANLVIMPEVHARDFLAFCERNPKPCPVLEVTEAGDPFTRLVADGADLRSDLPKYRVWRNGELADEPTDVRDLWQNDFVAFLTGCSFTFEAALRREAIAVRHIDHGLNVPMYVTDVPCESAGPFHGPLVVSMRPFPPDVADRAARLTAQYPDAHGAPVHLGNPHEIGIQDLSRPDFGDPVPIHEGEIPVFWACGVTAHTVAMAAKLPLVITHSPGCMFVTDVEVGPRET